MSVSVVIGALLAVALMAAALACGIDVRRREPRAAWRWAWWSALGLALLATPVTGAGVTLHSATTTYAGPDLLSDAPLEEQLLASSWVVPGLTRTETTRTTQEETLLSEETRHVMAIPVLFLLVIGGWYGYVGRRAAARVVPLVLLLSACGPNDAEDLTLPETRLAELMEMRLSGQLYEVEGVLHPLVVYEDLPNQQEHRGINEVADFILGLNSWASSLFIDLTTMRSGDDWAMAEWVLEGVQSAPIPGIIDSVTQRRVRQRGVTVVELESERIIRAVDYADMTPLFLDLGATLILPNGDTLRAPAPPPED